MIKPFLPLILSGLVMFVKESFVFPAGYTYAKKYCSLLLFDELSCLTCLLSQTVLNAFIEMSI